MRTNVRLETDTTIITDYYHDSTSRLGQLIPITKSIKSVTPATKTADGATMRIYERRVEVKIAGVQPPHLARCTRGMVSLDFSSKARKRMMAAINEWRIPHEHKSYFITLTYPDLWPSDWESWKTDLEKFRRAVLERFPQSQGFWRLELQKRGAPHYHIVLTMPKGTITNRSMYRWMRVIWARIAHKYDKYEGIAGTSVEVMDKQSAIYKYISKYSCKRGGVPVNDDGVILEDFDAAPFSGMGRHWGKIGKLSRQAYAEFDMLSLGAIDELKQVVIGWLRGKGVRYAEYLSLTPANISWDCVGIPGLALLLVVDHLTVGRGLLEHERQRVLSSA